MINLKSLQEKIDKLWENETSDSLTNWLMQKRNREDSDYS